MKLTEKQKEEILTNVAHTIAWLLIVAALILGGIKSGV